MRPVLGVVEPITVTLPVNPLTVPPRLVNVTTSVAEPPVAKLTVVEAGEIERPFTLTWSKAPVFAVRPVAARFGSHETLAPSAAVVVVTFTSLVTVAPADNVKGEPKAKDRPVPTS
jgi:hypothetical protein